MDMQKKLKETLGKIEAKGYVLREEWLEGSGGGCEIRGKKFFFSDQSLPLPDRLRQALDFWDEISKPH
ncbi:MAG: hypothetical protein Q4D62_12605 [Planctomycetia bacterium]|nr:hypothetical protein [Planctomycetia bacterium]